MNLYPRLRKASFRKHIVYLLIALMLLATVSINMPAKVSASPAWTSAWSLVSNAGTGEPATPYAITTDQNDNVYVTSGNKIYEYEKKGDGSFSWNTINKTGLTGNPTGIAVDKDGNLYVTDFNSSLVQYSQKDSSEWLNIGGPTKGQVWVPGRYEYAGGQWWWTPGFWTTANQNSSGIYGPNDIAVDGDSNVYVVNPNFQSDATYYNSLMKFQIGSWSVVGSQHTGALSSYISNVAVDKDGNVYVTTQYSSGTNMGEDDIRKLSGGTWSSIGDTANKPVNPGSIAVDKWGNIYVISTGDRKIKVFSEGKWTTIGGSFVSGPKHPNDLAVDGFGNLYVTDSDNGQVWKLQAPATQLVWKTQPMDGVAGKPFAQAPEVELRDGNNVLEEGESTHTVTLTLNNANGATMSSYTAKLVNGKATFSNLTINKAGSGYTLTASCDLSAGLTVGTSSAFSMNAPPAPVVTGVSPATGLGGTKVTITGTNLTAASLVEFGTTVGVNPIVNSDTSVTVTVPVHSAGAVDVRVTTPGGKSAVNSPGDQFTFKQPGAWVGDWTVLGSSASMGNINPVSLAIQSTGDLFMSDSNYNKIQRLSGSTWTNTLTSVKNPNGIAIDSRNYVYVADTNNYRILCNGSVFVNFGDYDHIIYAKDSGGNDVSMLNLTVRDLAIDGSGNIFITTMNKVFKWNSGTGAWTDITLDGAFSNAYGIAVDSLGNIYVSDTALGVVKKLPFSSPTAWTTIGTGFNSPYGIGIDGTGNIYVADYGNNAIKILYSGNSEWTSLGGMLKPYDVTFDTLGNIYVAGTYMIGGFDKEAVLKHQTPAMRLAWRTQPTDGTAGQDLTPYPMLALEDAYGNIVTGDSTDTVTLNLYSENGAALVGTTTVTMVNGTAYFVDLRVNKAGSGYILSPSCSLQGIDVFDSSPFNVAESTVQPPPPLTWSGGWTDIAPRGLNSLQGIAVDGNQDIYLIASNAAILYKRQSGSWFAALSGLGIPFGAAVDDKGSYYIADTRNYRILKDGYQLGSGLSFTPYGVAAGGDGTVYATGTNSRGNPFIVKWNGTAWVDIIYHGSFSSPHGIAVDSKGNVYVADERLKVVRKLPAGTNQWKTVGTGFTSLQGVAIDKSDNIYVTQAGDGGVVKVMRAGGIEWTAITNSGTWGVTDLAVDKTGTVYVSFNSYVYVHQAPATKLVWNTQPGGGIGNVAWSQQPVVYLEDANGNRETGEYSNTVTVTLNSTNGATLNGTSNTATVTFNQGKATFSNLKVDKPGTYTLTLSSSIPGLDCPTSDPFVITTGPADAGNSTVVAGKPTVTADGLDTTMVTVTVKDAYGNPLSGKSVTLAQGSGNSSILPSIAATDSAGKALFMVKSTKAETVTYTATDTTDSMPITQTAQVSFAAGAVDNAHSTVVVSKSVVTADNSDSATITVTLKDANDNPAAGRTVVLSQGSGSSSLSASSVTSDSSGTAIFTVKSTKSETVTYTITADGTVFPQTVQVYYKNGPAESIKVEAAGTQIAGTAFDVNITILDHYGNIVRDYTGSVRLETDSSSSPDGTAPSLPASYTFKQSDAGVHIFTGVVLYKKTQCSLTAIDAGNGAITGEERGIIVKYGAVDAGKSTVSADNTTIKADNSEVSTITAALKDAYGNPISGKIVTLSKDGGSSSIAPVGATSDLEGKAVFTVKNTKAEDVTYTVTGDGVILSTTVKITFVHGPAETLRVDAFGPHTAGTAFDINIMVKDHYGNTVTDYTGTLKVSTDNGSSPKGTAPVLPEEYTFAPGDNGAHTFSGVILYNAVASTLTVTDSAVSSITGSKTIAVFPAPVDAGESTVSASSTTVTADFVADAAITVVVKDSYGNPVPDKTVSLSQDSGSSNLSAVNAVSDANGRVTFTVKSTKAEEVTYTATADGVILTQTVKVTFTPGILGGLRVSTANTQVAGKPFSVTVTAQDSNGNVVTDYAGTVRLGTDNSSSPKGTAPILPGDYTFTAADKGIHTFDGVTLYNAAASKVTAQDTVNSTINGMTGNITVSAGQIDSGESAISADKLEITANNTDITTITVVLKDIYGNYVSGKTVSLSQGNGSSEISTANAVSDKDGKVDFTVISTKAEDVTYAAAADGITLTHTVKVTFKPGTLGGLKVEAANSQTAGAPFSVTVTAKDANGNIIPDYTGTVNISTNNGNSPGGKAPEMPQNYTFTQGDKGTHTFDGVILYNAAVSTLTAADAADGAINGKTSNITVSAGAVDDKESTMSASSAKAIADGLDSSTITVVLKDAYGNFVSGEKVTLDQGSGSSEITAVDNMSDASGAATFNVGSTKAEEVTYTATAGSTILDQAVSVTFEPGSLESLKISMASTQTAGAPFSVTVTAQDENGNIVTGYTGTISFSTDNGSSPSNMAPSLPQDYTFTAADNGTHTFTDEVTLYNAATTSITTSDISDDTYSGTRSNITVNPAQVDEGESTVETSSSDLTADNIASATITVTLRDKFDNLISSKTVSLAQNGNSDIMPSSTASGSDGKAAFTVKSTKTEEVTYTASANGTALNQITLNQTVKITFKAGQIDASHSTLEASKSTVTADSSDSSSITVTLKDAYGNPVSGKTVTLDQGSGGSTITTANSTSASDGSVVFTVTDANMETIIYTATADGVIINQTAAVNFTRMHNIKVSAEPNGGGTVTGGGAYVEGASVTVTANANNGYRFTSWTEGGTVVSSGDTYTFTMGTANRTLVANFATIPHSGGKNNDNGNNQADGTADGGSSTDGTANNTVSTQPAPASGSIAGGNESIVTAPTLDSSTGTASVSVGADNLTSAFNSVSANQNGVVTVEVDIPIVKGATAYEPTLPASFLSSGDTNKVVEIKTEIAAVKVPGNMLSAANTKGAQNVSLTIAQSDAAKLPLEVKEQIGSRPVIELDLKIDGQKVAWNNENAPVTVTMAYTPSAEELKNPEHITVWYIDGAGKAVSVPSGRYDPATGKVTFTTTHFSKYAVVFVRKTFTDISSCSWAKNQIEVLAAKGIINDTADNAYSPNAGITRADYLMMLVRTLGLTADFNSNFDDVKPEARYFKEIGIARKLGITAGVGNNKFKPDSLITRQDMMVLTEKALRLAGKISRSGALSSLDKFSDKNRIAPYAATSMAILVREGLIEGSGSSIRPMNYTSRAEAAAFLYRIYNMK